MFKQQQVVKLILQKKAASPPHMDGLIVFARLRQCAPMRPNNNYYNAHNVACSTEPSTSCAASAVIRRHAIQESDVNLLSLGGHSRSPLDASGV